MNAPERQALTVTELNTLAKEYLENLPLFRSVSVKGDLSNVTLHRTGHIYFSIKDEGAAVSAVMWRSDAASLGFTPENGQKVTAEGKVTLWVQRGQYTFNVRTMQKDGAGDLFAAFEALKRKLAAEGLFDASRKKPLPKYPRTVGIITAPTGAAIRDMINVTGRRFPLAKILLYPTLVQGESAPPQMIEALQAFNREKKADVIILGRGGGSAEDLWAFNDEALARAICASEIPVVSAVGHEVDYTIADFAADLRAPTPSAAAELVVPDRGETKRRLGDTSDRRAKVFLSILYPFKIQTKFGDLCGDGDFLDMSKLKDRKKAIKWLIDTQLALFRSRNYQYSELCGFYWFEESILISDRDEKEMIQWTTDYVRSLGYKTIWIPYYRASGYNKWWEYGVDYACMQPNHSFRDDGVDLIHSAAEITKKYGMCVEMEIGGTSEAYVAKYNDYLRVGAETGFMDSVHMYYQGGGPGEFYEAYRSADRTLNDVYHNTYLFTQNRYRPEEK